MSGIVNVFEGDAEDFGSEGLGVLVPSSWEYENKGAAGAVLTMEHPYDPEERWGLIRAGRIIRADVPIRTTPEIDAGAMIQTAEQWTVNSTGTKEQRRMYSKATNGKKKKVLPKGTAVTVVKKGEQRYKVKASKYGTGWIAIAGLDVKIMDVPYDTVAAVEAATPSVQVRPQLFRLQQPKYGEEKITVDALPVAYDAAGILTDPHTDTSTSGVQAVENIVENTYWPMDELEIYTDIADERTAYEKRDVNVIDALLNGDDSFIGRWGGDVLFDDWTITILREAGMDRGFYATYGRNLIGIESFQAEDDITTCILPIGEKENGKPLYLDGNVPYMLASNWEDYPVIHMTALKVSDAKVSKKDGVTEALARQRMRAAAQAEFDKGVSVPAITLKIDFALLGDSEEYREFRELDQCHIYDIVHVWHPRICGYVRMRVAEATWDGMKQRYTSMVLGTPERTMEDSKISSSQISGKIDGSTIVIGSISAAALSDGAIASAMIQDESITTEKLADGAVTADKILNGVVSAAKLQEMLSSSALKKLGVRSGTVSFASVPAGGTAAQAVSFALMPTTDYRVVATVTGAATTDAMACRIAITNKALSGFTMTVENPGNYAMAVDVDWVALISN